MTQFIHWISRSKLHTFLSLLAITISARFITFFRLTIDYDETTYAVIADHMLQGAVLYKDLVDIKQPGIFVIFSIIQLLFGKSVVMIRLVTALTIATSGYLLYLTKRKLEFDFRSSLLSAVAFILMFNFYFGFATNTEVFFIFCSSLGLYIFFKYTRWFTCLLSGLVFGIGFTIKQHVAFDFAALGLFFFGWSIYCHSFKKNFLPMALMVIGFLIPPALIHLTFWYFGYYEYYHFISYVAPGNYSSQNNFIDSLYFLWKAILVYLPFALATLIGVKSFQWKNGIGWFIGLWILMAAIAVAITGQGFTHYYLQFALPVSFAAGEIASVNFIRRFFSKKYVARSAFGILLIYTIFLSVFYYNRYIVKPNVPSDLVDFLDGRLTEDMTLYTGDSPQYLYWHFDKLSPTPYIHSTLLTKQSNIHTLDIDLESELERIYNSQPDIIILSENYPYRSFYDQVARSYDEIGQVHEFKIYKR